MKARIKNYLMMNKKVHYKMYKSGKSWVVAGIATLGLGLAVTASSVVVKADLKDPLTIETKPTKKLSEDQLYSLNGRGQFHSFGAQSQTFKQQYGTPLTGNNSQPVFGEIKISRESTLKYFYGDGTDRPLATVGYSDPTGQINTSDTSVSLMGALPNFNVFKTVNGKTEHISNALYDSGRRRGRIKIGINNDINTLTGPMNGSQRLWSIEKVPTPGLKIDPNNPDLNYTLISKYSSDYKINGKVYTIDYTQTFKPMGSYVDYQISARNVTGLDSDTPNDPSNDLKGLFFESDFDTWFKDEDYRNEDSAPMYYLANNTGLYSKGHGYKLKYIFTSPTAPTGWKSPVYAYSDAKKVFNFDPNDLGSKVPANQKPHKEGELATTYEGSGSGWDPGLFMIWKSQDLAQGDSRKLSYQTGLTDANAIVPKVSLDKQEDNYIGQDYTVTGKVSHSDTSALPLKYYYEINGGERVEFTGPVITDSSEHNFQFTIPKESMIVGNEQQISVYVEDGYGTVSEPAILKLTANAEIKAKDLNYFVGDKFDKFDSFDGGSRVDGQPISASDVSEVKIQNAAGQEVPADQVTTVPGKYKVTYTYRYGSGVKGGSVSATGNVNVYAPNDPDHGADFSLRDKTYYVGDPFNADDVFVSGRKNGNSPMAASDLTHTIQNGLNVEVNDANVTSTVGDYKVTYKYSYGNNGQSIAKTSNVRVIDTKYIKINYVDDSGNPIDARYLSGVSNEMKSGNHTGSYGSEFNVNPAQTLDDAYNFVRAESIPNPITNNKLVFGDENQTLTLVYQGASIPDSSANAVKVHHYLEGTTTTVPGMTDFQKGGRVGDTLKFKLTDDAQKAPAGYELAPGQSDQEWTLKPDQGKEIIFYYKAKTQDNITIDFTDVTTGESVTQSKPGGTHHTGEELDIKSEDVKSKIPDGYHMAEGDELNGKTQPANPKYTNDPQTSKVWIIGNKVADDASNAVKVHHYLEGTTTVVPGMTDFQRGGRIGQKLVFKLTDPEQKAPAGYELAPGQEDQSWTLKVNEGKEITFYYKAKIQDNITIDFTDVTTGESVTQSKPGGTHHTGEELDIKSEDVKSKIPDGYHMAEGDELGNNKQPKNPKYTNDPQTPKVWIIGNKVADDDSNAVTIHHYLQKPDGTKTTTKVPGLEDIHKGGRVGETKTFTPAAAPAGYTLKSQPVEWTFKANEGKVINFYYEANDASNITVKFRSSRTDKDITTDRPQGLTGDVLDLSATSSYVAGKTPKGYHYSTSNELRSNQKQATNLTFGLTPQTTTVYLTPEKDTSIEIILEDATTGEKIKVKPENHFTGDELDLKNDEEIKNKIPDGFHIAEPGELGEGKGQPTENPKYDTTHKEEKIYIIGDKIDKNATNAVTIHHYLQKSDGTKTTTKVPGLNDLHIGGRVGETKTFTPAAAPAGYTLKSEPVEWTFKVNEGKVINFYYEAGEQNNIKVHFINVKNGKELVTDNPVGTTGSVLDLAPTADYVQGMLSSKTELKGYHYATGRELNGKTQSKNPTYTTSEQHVKVFVAGDKVSGDNAVSVQHRLKENGQLTDKPVPGMRDFSKDGYVGDEFTFKTDDREQQAPRGYKLVDGQADQLRTLGLTAPDPVIFYYEAIEQNNVTVAFVNTETGAVVGTDKPSGAFGSTLDLTPNGSYLANKIPSGYHYAKRGELRSGQQQPRNLTYTTEDQTVRVYIAADVISDDSEDAVTIHHYVKGTNDKVVGLDDIKRGGRYGETVTFKKDAPEHLAPKGYKMSDDQTDLSWTFGQQGGDRNLRFDYEKVDLNNITVKYVNIKNNQVILTENPVGKIGEELDLHIGDDSELPDGYKYPTTDELAGRTQATNPTYSSKDQEVTVYVTPKGFPTSAQMKIKYVNVNNPNDNYLPDIWEVDLTGHYEGEPIDLNQELKEKNSGNSKPVIPKNYHYADKSELKDGQIQKEKLTYTNGTITIYVVGNWIDASNPEAPVITHRLNSYNGAFVPGLRDIRQGGRYGDPVMINVKDPIHRSRKYDPKKYSVDTDGSTKPIPSNGLIQTSFGQIITIIYGR